MSGPTEEDAARERARRQKIQQQLDEALAESSPASDPVSIVTSGELRVPASISIKIGLCR